MEGGLLQEIGRTDEAINKCRRVLSVREKIGEGGLENGEGRFTKSSIRDGTARLK